TDSRKVDGEDYGVYAKGTRHRLRIIVKGVGAGKTTLSVERMLFRRERILFVDNDEPLPTTDHSVEQTILAAIAKALCDDRDTHAKDIRPRGDRARHPRWAARHALQGA